MSAFLIYQWYNVDPMEKLTAWLRQIEFEAFELYVRAASSFKEDTELSSFLIELANDESLHYHLMTSAGKLLEESPEYSSVIAIQVDKNLQQQVEEPLKICEKALKDGALTKKGLLELIMLIEFSELNELFVFVMQYCQQFSKTFQKVSSVIQHHEQRIENFIGTVPEEIRPSKRTDQLPEIWKNRILLVDDDKTLRHLFSKLLSRTAEVVTAENGKQALEIMDQKHFDVILCDIQMPVMDGIKLFEKVRKDEPDISKRLIFWTGYVSNDVEKISQENGIPLLLKPIIYSDLKAVIDDILP